MEFILQLYNVFLTDPYFISSCVYGTGMLIQLAITSLFFYKRIKTLVQEYGHTKPSLYRLFIVSVLLWPVSMFYGLKSIWHKWKDRGLRRPIEDEEEDWERERDEHG